MVRPFLRWMVSARAPLTPSATKRKIEVTGRSIQAHSSNGGGAKIRDQGTTRQAYFRVRDHLYVVGSAAAYMGVRESSGQAGGDALYAADASRVGPCSHI